MQGGWKRLLLHLVLVVDEVLIFVLILVLLEVLRGLGEVDVATTSAPAHDVLLVDLLHVVLIGLLDLLGAGFLQIVSFLRNIICFSNICATHLTALRVVLVVVHGVIGSLALALLDRGLDGGVVGLVLGDGRILDGVAHICGFGGVVVDLVGGVLVVSGVGEMLGSWSRMVGS